MAFFCPVPGMPCMNGLADDFLWDELRAVLAGSK